MLALDVKNEQNARYVESHIGRADLEGFVCEVGLSLLLLMLLLLLFLLQDAMDVNTLTTELREKLKLRRINVFHSNPDPPESFRHPFSKVCFFDCLSSCFFASFR